MNADSALRDYLLAHIDPEPPYLHRLYRQTNISLLQGRMASGHLQGRLLAMLCRLLAPRHVLEIGTYTGYSTLCMASGLSEGALIDTFEANDEMEDFTRPWLEGSPWAARIRLHMGPVQVLLPPLAQREHLSYDLAFIDGDKRQYSDYYRLCLSHMRAGALIVADNTLWDGHVVAPAYDRDAQTLGIRAFNDLVAADGRVEQVILPLRDGLSLIRIK